MFDLAIAALIGFPFGVLVGYLWRDRISRARRARHRAEQEMRPGRIFGLRDFSPTPLDLKRGPIGQVTRTPAILFFARPAARPRRRSSDFSFDSAANRKKIAVGELERIAAGDHRVAILEFDEAGIHRAAHDDKTELAFPALPVPAIDVRLLTHDTPRFRAPPFSIHATVAKKPISPTAAIRISQRSTMPNRLNG
jgi:hypothetical protein